MGPTEVIKEVSLGRGGERRAKRRRPDGRIGEGGILARGSVQEAQSNCFENSYEKGKKQFKTRA